MYLLERAREKGVRLVEGRLEGADTAGGRVRAVTLATREGRTTLGTPRVVNAAGPFFKHVGRLLGVELPVFCERHAKVAFNDTLRAVPRAAPMLIWTDPVRLPWSPEERVEISASREHRRLLEEFPAGVHGRPEGAGESPAVLLIWTYDVEPVEPTFPLAFDPAYGEIALRGMSRMLPALGAAAALRRGRGVLHQDTREPLPRRAVACRGRVRAGRALGLRADGVERRRGSPRRPHRRAAAAALRPRLRARALRGSGLPQAARHLGRWGAAVGSARPSLAAKRLSPRVT